MSQNAVYGINTTPILLS